MIETTTVIFILIYLFTILLAATEIVTLSVAALTGGLLSVWFGLSYGLFNYNEALAFVDMKILALLVGVMVVIEVAEESGIFHVLSLYTIKLAGGNPTKLFFSICFTAAIVSLFLSDVTAILLIAAAAGTIARILDYDPTPYFVSSAIMVNLGGVSTMIGSISNMIIAVSSGLSFVEFINYLTLCEVILWILTSVILYIYFKPRLGKKKTPPQFNPWEVIKDRSLFRKSLFILILFLFLFFIYDIWNVGPEAVALGCAILALAISGVDPSEIFKRLDWETIFFIGGFFLIIGGVEKTGLLASTSRWIFNFSGGNQLIAVLITLWSSGLASAFVSNIAIALTYTPIIKGLQLPDLTPIWSALVLGTNLGGASTPFSGAVCVLVMSALKREGIKLSFSEFTKIGFLTSFAQLAFSTLYLLVRFNLWS